MMNLFGLPVGKLMTACVVGLAISQASCKQAVSEKPSAPVTQAEVDKFQVTYVDAIGASALLASNSDVSVIDLRTQSEIDNGHIEGAVFADFYAEDFADQLSKFDREKAYVIHCNSGGRSTKALATFESLGFTNITHMDGGVKGWNKANLPLTKP